MVTKTKVKEKKSTPKRTASTKRVLICANGEQCFWTTDGKIIANLVELRDTLASMADEVFQHHVTSDRNDFAEWVQHVLADQELAELLRSAQKPATARTYIVRRLKEYDI